MKLLRHVQEFAAFTKNEQKVFLFLSLIFLAGVSLKVYKAYFVHEAVPRFDYSASDREFQERSRRLSSVPAERGPESALSGPDAGAPVEVFNLNTATKEDLLLLPGIGNGIAEQIIKFRKEHGAFSSVDDLRRIKGIGPKKLAKLRPYLRLK